MSKLIKLANEQMSKNEVLPSIEHDDDILLAVMEMNEILYEEDNINIDRRPFIVMESLNDVNKEIADYDKDLDSVREEFMNTMDRLGVNYTSTDYMVRESMFSKIDDVVNAASIRIIELIAKLVNFARKLFISVKKFLLGVDRVSDSYIKKLKDVKDVKIDVNKDISKYVNICSITADYGRAKTINIGKGKIYIKVGNVSLLDLGKSIEVSVKKFLIFDNSVFKQSVYDFFKYDINTDKDYFEKLYQDTVVSIDKLLKSSMINAKFNNKLAVNTGSTVVVYDNQGKGSIYKIVIDEATLSDTVDNNTLIEYFKGMKSSFSHSLNAFKTSEKGYEYLLNEIKNKAKKDSLTANSVTRLVLEIIKNLTLARENTTLKFYGELLRVVKPIADELIKKSGGSNNNGSNNNGSSKSSNTVNMDTTNNMVPQLPKLN